MESVRKAVWFIESHFASPIGLGEIAEASALSRFHFSRVFAQVTGLSVSEYVRGRRLTHAAHELAKGAPDILSLALDVGYGSHEAFTRAFREQFGVTPEDVRARRCLENLTLVEPFVMAEQATIQLPEPVIADKGPFFLAGLREFRTFRERSGIPGQWQRFGPHVASASNRAGGDSFGVCFAPSNGEEGFDYLTAIAVKSLDDLPEDLSGARIAKRRYAMFKHDGHVSTIGATCAAIFGEWQPKSGLTLEHDPFFLIEYYGPSFQIDTGRGGMEVWAPIKA